MNAWINKIAELAGIGHTGIDFSLSDMSQFVPDARLLWIAGAAVVFMLVASCDNRWFGHHEDDRSETHRK